MKSSLLIWVVRIAAPTRRLPIVLIVVPIIFLVHAYDASSANARSLAEFAAQYRPHDFFADATRFGEPRGTPPLLPVFEGAQLAGHVYLTTDFTAAVGYSGKPVRMLVGIDTGGTITALKLVEHKEPIVLVGVPEQKVVDAVNKLVGTKIAAVAAGTARAPQPDVISGATVTVLVMADSVVRSAVRLFRDGRLGGEQGEAPHRTSTRTVDTSRSEVRDWPSLLKDGSVQRLKLTVGAVNDAFAKSGNNLAAANPEPGDPGDTFIDLYAAPASVPTIGRSLLGRAVYERLRDRLKPGQQAIVVAATGPYSFKGSGYVRGGIFDRIEIEQDGEAARFRDRNHERLGELAASGAPALREISLFTVPDGLVLDLAEPWTLRLLVQRATGPRSKALLAYDLRYALPDTYLAKASSSPEPAPVGAAREGASPDPMLSNRAGPADEPLWKQMWRRSSIEVAVTSTAIGVLTVIFFFQNTLVRRPRLYTWVRRAFLAFTLFWLGWYANAQLSVVNVLTFTNALVTGFSWDYFLTSPLIFILWSSVAVALLFWGRGPYCGWLCPFGALQELTNNVARALRVPQLRVNWDLHERLWPVKYVIFLILFGYSLYSIAGAEQLAEVEPFKTAIVLKFFREWPFVIYALALLVAGLFVERFFCRYLCPLGAALAIPGRMRMFDWLRRWPECGSPCQRCANECPVQSIHPDGRINPNECIYCMHCQELYWDDHRCPHMIQVRLKRERRGLASPVEPAPPTRPRPLLTYLGKVVR